MKKRFLLGLVTLGAASMLCGFDSAETADSLYAKMQEAGNTAESMTMDMGMNVDVALNVGDGTTTSSIAVAMNGDFDVAYTMNPLAMKMDGSMNLSTFGQQQQLSMKMYGVTNDANEFETYVYSEDSANPGAGTWAYEKGEGMDLSKLLEASESVSMSDLSEYGLSFTLAPEAADVDGKECYLLSTVIDTNTISTAMAKVSELAGQDLSADQDVATALALLDGLKMNVEYYVDTTTYLPVKMHMDFNGSDVTTLNQLLQASMAQQGGESAANATAEIVLNDISIDAVVSYDAVEPITVPEEALAAVASGAAESVSDLASDVEGAVEG